MASDYPQYMTTREAQNYSGLRNLATRRVQGNSPPFIKTGEGKNSRVLYARAELDAWLQARTRKSTSDSGSVDARAA